MSIVFQLVAGAEFAQQASAILNEAWKPPALRYTPEYLRWQMSFPSVAAMPAAAAFDGAEPVGFAGTSARQFRFGDSTLEAAVVSFVGVRPGWQRQGIAAGLYRTLLGALANAGLPVVTFAVTGSDGERTLLRAYTEAGFSLHAMGTYSNYGYLGATARTHSDWRCYACDDPRIIESLSAQLDGNGAVLWNWPDREQMEHYFADPRPRKLLVVEHRSRAVRGAGFVVLSDFKTAQGIQAFRTLDSVWLPGEAASSIQCLLQAAAKAWSTDGAMLVSCPNLSGVEDAALAAIRAKRTGGVFSAYFCTAARGRWPAFERTNLEIV